jgi:hypothetical protein
MKLCWRVGLVLTVCVLAAASASATTTSSLRTLKFSTGAFAVNCTSTGELCSPAKKLTFKLRRSGTLTKITYTTAATHCSAVQVHVLLKGHEVTSTGILASGNTTERLKTHIALAKGLTTLGFKAQGFLGGCNVGRVVSWGGTIVAAVKTH